MLLLQIIFLLSDLSLYWEEPGDIIPNFWGKKPRDSMVKCPSNE